jgi:hypothetical protein
VLPTHLVIEKKKEVLMAKVKLNPIVKKIRGQVGDLIFRRYGDGVILAQKPEWTETPPSDAQQVIRDRFRQAALYGKLMMADPETKMLYEKAAKIKGQPVFSLAVADFFNAPAVDEVDLSAYGGKAGDSILVAASDDFKVLAVEVILTDAEGQLLEGGAAVETPAESGLWLYTATTTIPTGTTVRIAVNASDRPGTKATAEKEKAI